MLRLDRRKNKVRDRESDCSADSSIYPPHARFSEALDESGPATELIRRCCARNHLLCSRHQESLPGRAFLVTGGGLFCSAKYRSTASRTTQARDTRLSAAMRSSSS